MTLSAAGLVAQTPDNVQFGQDSSMVMGDSVIIAHSDLGKIDSILKYAEKFIGVPYGFGSTGTRTFDCSGYVMHVFSKFGYSLPHGSSTQCGLCREIKKKHVRPGDLVFFSGRKVSKSQIGHVAIVHHIDGDDIFLIHATVQAGVIVESMNNSAYFSKRFIRFGRIPGLFSDKK